MNILDGIIVLVILVTLWRSLEIGFTRRFFTIVGFLVGALAGAYSAPFLLRVIAEPSVQLFAGILAILLSTLAIGSLGRLIGDEFASFVRKINLGKLDVFIGGVLSVFMVVGGFWLFSSMFSGIPSYDINRHISQSTIMQNAQEKLPPAPEVLGGIAHYMLPSDFPGVLIETTPRPMRQTDPSTSEEMTEAVDAASLSTVRIESTGCGGLIYGSGFIAEPGIVITNAHVIAGIEQPIIVDEYGRHEAEVIYYDASLDMAVLRSDTLVGEPLKLVSDVLPSGTNATTLGYPFGGQLESTAAVVRGHVEASGQDIYNDAIAERSIYYLDTEVTVGNSGGPVVLADGTVIGMVFARSIDNEKIGYAISSDQIKASLSQAMSENTVVNTRECVSPAA